MLSKKLIRLWSTHIMKGYVTIKCLKPKKWPWSDGSVGCSVVSHTERLWLDPRSGHIPRAQVESPVGHEWEAAGSLSHIDASLPHSPCLFLSLSLLLKPISTSLSEDLKKRAVDKRRHSYDVNKFFKANYKTIVVLNNQKICMKYFENLFEGIK